MMMWYVIKQLEYLNSYGMPVICYFEVFIKMMSDFLSNQEDISVHVMHCVCCYAPLVWIQKRASY